MGFFDNPLVAISNPTNALNYVGEHYGGMNDTQIGLADSAVAGGAYAASAGAAGAAGAGGATAAGTGAAAGAGAGGFMSGGGALAAAGLLSAYGQYVGQTGANQTNLDIARETNTMAQNNAREQMSFQERMSSTAHQREVSDLKAAGLNPILSANAGSSSPSGAAGSTTTGAPQQNPAAGLSATALQVMQLKMAMEKQKTDIEYTNSQRAKADMETRVLKKGVPESDLKNDIYDIARPWIKKAKDAMTTTSPKPDTSKWPKEYQPTLP